MNSQLMVGKGTSSYPKTTGATNSLGMTDTVGNGGNGDNGSINFFGLENWWGDIEEWIDNVKALTESFWYIYDPLTESIKRTIVFPIEYVSDTFDTTSMYIGSYFDMTGVKFQGTPYIGYCDYFIAGGNNSIVSRSNIGSQVFGGIVYANTTYTSSDVNQYTGSRLSYTGTIQEIEDPTEFLAL